MTLFSPVPHRRRSFAAFAAFLLATTSVFAQSSSLEIRARNAENNRPLPGVTISLASRDGDVRAAVTDDDGQVTIPSLAPGLYALSGAASGFIEIEEPSVRLIGKRTTLLRLALRPADTSSIEEVVVTARARFADPYGASSSSFLNREELRSAVGAGSDVMRALDGLPGLISTGDFANFTVRGRSPRDNLIFVDGFPLDKVVHFDQSLGEEEDIGGGGRFSIFAPNSIQGAEFSPGGWSAAFGGRAGSLLQLNVAGGGPSPSASMRLDIAGVELGYDGPSGFHDGTTLYMTARNFDFGRVFEQIDQEDIGAPRLTDIILKSVTDVNANNTIEVLAIHAPEDYTRDIDNVLASPDFEDVSLLDSEQDLSLLGLTWRRLVGDTGEWVNRFYVRDSDKTSSEGEAFPDLVPPNTAPGDIPVEQQLVTITEDESEIGWRSDFTWRSRFGPASAGLRLTRIDAALTTNLRQDWNRFVFRTTDPRPSGQNFITLTPDAINASFSAARTSYAVFAEQVFEFDRLDVRVGGRVDRDGFSEETLFSPRLAANMDLGSGLRVSATAGVFYQSPRFLDRAANDENFALENERIVHFSVGFEKDFGPDWTLLVEPYYQTLDNLVTEEGRATGRLSNAGDGRNLGADVVLTRRFGNGWFANATYSYNDAQINDNDGLGDYDADNSRPHFFSVGGSWEINQRWKVGARWKYASGRPTDEFIIYDDVLGPGQPLRFGKELTRQNSLRLDDYHSLNIRVDYRRNIGPADVVAFVDIINVYGGPQGAPLEFDPRRGINIDEDGDAFPLIGLIFERSW